MPHLGNTVATDCDYYTTHLGIRIDTDGQVMEWTHRNGSSNLSHSTITNVFKRNNAPTLPTLEVICRAFGITLAQFFAEGGEAVEITDEQRELFAKWSTRTEKQKALLLEFISTLQ